MSKQRIRLDYCGMEGEGETVAKAKQDAGRKIEAALKAADEPVEIVAVRGYAALVAYSIYAQSWGSRLILDDGMVRTGPQWITTGDPTKQAARIAALRHVATLAWRFDDDDEAFAHEATKRESGCPLNHTERREIVAEILRNAQFQRHYRACNDAGMNDAEARAIACGYPLRPTA